jgi:hypothetical protein
VHSGCHRGSEIQIWTVTRAGASSCIRDFDDAVARVKAAGDNFIVGLNLGASSQISFWALPSLAICRKSLGSLLYAFRKARTKLEWLSYPAL